MQRRLTLLNATTVNMSNMVGIGPFIAIALILQTLAGPQAYLAWVIGTVIALADGLVVAELGAAVPAAGGTYVFLREGFGPRTWGRMLAFLFVWQILFAGPLEIASGNIGLVQYLRVFLPDLSAMEGRLLAAGICVLLVYALYRRIDDIAKVMFCLWSAMLLTTGWVIVTGLMHFDPALAFDLPDDAFRMDWTFLKGLGEGSGEVLYLFLGYYQVCYLGAEVREPGRTIPRAVLYSILAVCVDRYRDLFQLHRRGSVAGGDAVAIAGRPLRGTRLRCVGGQAARCLDRLDSVRIDLRAAAGVLAGALRRSVRWRFLPAACSTSSDQGVPPPLAPTDRRGHGGGEFLQPGQRHQGPHGRADPDPVHWPHARAVPNSSPPSGHRATLSHVVVSLARRRFASRVLLRVPVARDLVYPVRGRHAAARNRSLSLHCEEAARMAVCRRSRREVTR